MDKGDLAIDARGLIYEAYRIDGIGAQDCRTIFLDWALGLDAGTDQRQAVEDLIVHYADRHPGHPMTDVLLESRKAQSAPRRRGGRSGRGKP